MDHLPDEVARSIAAGLGSAESTTPELVSYAKTLIEHQSVDIDKLASRLQSLNEHHEEKQETLSRLMEKTHSVHGLLGHLTQWESALKTEEDAIRKEVERLETSLGEKCDAVDKSC